LIVVAAVMALAGCSLDKQAAPALSGPSELGLSLAVTATPDIISQDGQSQSTIAIVARDASSQPVGGLTLRAEMAVGSVIVDFGTLSSRTVSTGSDGRATLKYIAPPPPPATASDDAVVTIIVTPVGNNYQNSTSRSVAIRLARPGVILPPNGTPVPKLFFSPTAPMENENVLFDGSQSADDGQIVAYVWNFGDGGSASGMRVNHSYGGAGTYNVVLTVTDDRGLSASTAPTAVAVTLAANPTASFVISPTLPDALSPVNVNGSASKATPGRILVSWEWDFGDGTPHTSGVTSSHEYAKAGTYAITLVVTDDAGRIGVTSSTITVK
jgi:PKD repeat protein